MRKHDANNDYDYIYNGSYAVMCESHKSFDENFKNIHTRELLCFDGKSSHSSFHKKYICTSAVAVVVCINFKGNTATIYLMHMEELIKCWVDITAISLRPRLPSYLFIYCLHIHKTWNLNILIDNECSETMRQWRRNNHVSNKALWPQKYFPETHNIYCWYPFSSRQIVYQNFCCRKLWGESSMLLRSVYLASRVCSVCGESS